MQPSNYSEREANEKLNGAACLLLDKLKKQKSGAKKSEGWLTSVHQYPPLPAAAEVFTLHVYRANWFNDDRQGIHFETFIGPKEWKKKQIQIAMHIFHCETIPGTTLKRRAVAVPFVDEIYGTVANWDGYVFRAGKYGAHPFTKVLSFDVETLEDKLADELLRLCLNLGPKMDATLESVLS
jgi:hypothetical protein